MKAMEKKERREGKRRKENKGGKGKKSEERNLKEGRENEGRKIIEGRERRKEAIPFRTTREVERVQDQQYGMDGRAEGGTEGRKFV